MLASALKRNYKLYNETALDNEKIILQHLKIEFEIDAIPAGIVSNIGRIEMIGKPFGVTVECIKSEKD